MTDASALFHRDTWSFSAEEIKALNEVSSGDMVTELADSITNKTDYANRILMGFRYTIKVNDNHADWTKFKVIDLNGDGIAEIVVYISNGRQPGGNLYILSRKSGRHYCDAVSCDNGGMRFWPTDKQALIIGAEALFRGATVDPYHPMEVLYAWTGANCVDVSRKYGSFYESQVIPGLTNELSRAYQNVIHGKMEVPLLVEAVQWALTADKLNEMFPDFPGARDLIKKACDLLNALQMEDDENPRLVREFQNVRTKIRLRIATGS
ncbi:MAG: FG-GAP repeat protein [Kiritimatiellia bacterium]|nr:FG-GAP repeat protein [Kiritimatiellia bacterium]